MRALASRNLTLILAGVTVLFPFTAHAETTWPSSVFHSSSQKPEDRWTALYSGDGILFIWNRPGLSFTLSLKGKEVRPQDAGENIFFVIDGMVLQIQSLPIANFAVDARKNKLSDDAILNAHRDWESGFIENELLHRKISVKSATEKLTNGQQAMLWQYELPEGFRNPDAKTQMYVTVIAKDYLILLNSVANDAFSEDKVTSFLKTTMSTLKISSERIDVTKEQEKLRKSQP
jgi:hypothetical protein